MKIRSTREGLLEPMTLVGGVIERKQTLQILSNIKVTGRDGWLTLIGTDNEVELRTTVAVDLDEELEITLPARKFTDILRALPEGASVDVEMDGEKATIRSGRSRFTLGTLPARDYPSIEPANAGDRFTVPRDKLRRLVHRTQFAMGIQDVRYYLNGMLLEFSGEIMRTVATDGHRMALSEDRVEGGITDGIQVILPRKAVLELGRLLSEKAVENLEIEISPNHVRVYMGETIFTTKLVDGKYPDYQRVIPAHNDRIVTVDRALIRSALQRAAILSNEKYRGINFLFKSGVLELLAHNPEQEEAKEEVEIDYEGEEVGIGFNVGYLMEVLNVIEEDKVRFELGHSDSSCLVIGVGDETSRYVVMPMRI